MDKVCQKCVNFLSPFGDFVDCDYEHFENIKMDIAILNVPEMFDCENYEEIEE